MRVLYVEDNAADGDLARRELQRAAPDTTVEIAATLTAARERLASSGAYDLVLSDLDLPDGNGLELVSEIRERQLPLAVVVLTRQGDESTAVAALKAGADDYVAKHVGYLERLPRALAAALAHFRTDSLRRGRPLRVLYAEHEATDIDLTQRHLERHAPHIRLEVVATSRQALARLPLRAGEPLPCDVMLLDYRLPDENALEVLKEILSERALDLPVIVVTGHGDEEIAAQALRLGASDYVVKHQGYLHALPAVLENAYHRASLVRENAALRVSEERFRNLVETTFDWVWEVDTDLRYIYASPKVRDLLGYAPEEVLGRTPFEFMPEAEAARVRAFFRPITEKRQAFAAVENLNHHRDGRNVVLESSGAPVFGPGGVWLGYRGMDRDITARREAEKALGLRSAALEAAADAVVITDRTGTIEWANPAFTAISGWPAEEAIGKDLRELIKSGQHDGAFFRQMWETLLAGRVWRGEIVNRRRDGALRTEHMTITPLRDGNGDIAHFIAIKQDITDQKAMEAHLLQSQRMEAIGTLAGGIAHDLNNMLAPILLAAGMLKDRFQDEHDRSMFAMTQSSALRAAEIVKQLLIFSRGQSGEPRVIQPRHLMKEVVAMMRETFPREIDLSLEVPATLWTIVADPTQLHQIVLNLCVNARDAMPEGGRLLLGAENLTLAADEPLLHPAAKAGSYVVIAVSDTGHGIPPEIRHRIFDPFFTTKPLGKGTGLGLSTVLGIVRSHHGFVTVDSTPGKGSTFKVYFPGVPSGVEATAEVPAQLAAVLPGHQTILVVDDESNVLEATRRVLEQQEYVVLTAREGEEALMQFLRHRSEIRLVLTDLMMPVMSGIVLIRALRVLDPKLRIIATSGVIDGTQGGELKSLGVSEVLAKPYDGSVLVAAVHRCLSEG